jgi:predicted LPLAT superfamily acyltransferase
VIGLAPIWFMHYNRPRYGVVLAMRRMGMRFPWWSALGAYTAYTLSLVDRHFIRAGRLTPQLVPGGREGLDAAIAQPGPLVFLGSHCGSLELAVPALESMGRAVMAVAVRDPAAQQLLDGVGDPARSVGGTRATIVADGTPAAGLRMLRALREGDVLAFKSDRCLPGSQEKQLVRASLWGDDVWLPRGPAEIVRLAEARAWTLSVFRVGPGRFRLLADEVPTDSGDSREIAKGFAQRLERHVSTQPNQWFNFFPYWIDDGPALAHVPETVPPGMRAAVYGLRGGLTAGVVAAFLGLSPVGLSLTAGVLGGVLAGLLGMSLGAARDPDGRRNPVARGTAALAPALALFLILLSRGPQLALLTVVQALLAVVFGWAASSFETRAGR